MKKILTTSIVDPSRQQPFTGLSLNFLQVGVKEIVTAVAYAVGPPDFSAFVLQGLAKTGNVIADGYIYDNGEICFVTGDDTTGYANIPVLIVDNSFDGVIDPITMSDGTTASVHQTIAYKIVDQVSGTGYSDYEDLEFTVRTTAIKIGNWDMDATGTLSVAHGLTLANMRSIDVHIYEDATINLIPLNFGGSFSADGTNVNLVRTAAGTFDSVNFNSSPFNRGWITIRHI